MDVLIIGVGNEDRGDDAAGLAVARRVRDEAPARAPRLASSVTIVESAGELARLIDLWRQAPCVLLIDAMRSGAAPGTIAQINPATQPLPADIAPGSSHALGVAEAIGLARQLDLLPECMLIYGIEGASFAFGARLSPIVQRAVGVVAERIWSALEHSEASLRQPRAGQ